ncbi:hypothetical protein Tco_1397250, partial [Tanacetum coccineum]
EGLKMRILEAWGGCSHKKIVAGSAITAFWNLTSIKTRIFAAIGYKDIERASEEALGITSLVIYGVFQKVVHQLGHSSEPDWLSSGLCSIKSSTAPLHMEGSSIMLYGIYI